MTETEIKRYEILETKKGPCIWDNLAEEVVEGPWVTLNDPSDGYNIYGRVDELNEQHERTILLIDTENSLLERVDKLREYYKAILPDDSKQLNIGLDFLNRSYEVIIDGLRSVDVNGKRTR